MTETEWSGKTLGSCHLLEKIGQGGMGAVYRAEQPRVRRFVAVKVLLRQEAMEERADVVQRFEREARILASLTHPHILPLYEFGESQGILYLVMPLMAGGSLSARRRPGMAWALPMAQRLFEPLAEALDYAHANHVLHRDLKPQNVLFDAADRPYLADFGIARLLSGGHTLTEAGALIGTPAYMSPEQARGDPHLDARSDIYTLGVMVYEALTGSLPFEAETPIALSRKHISDLPRPPRQVRPDLTDEAEVALLTALAKNPEARYPKATHFIQALQTGASSAATSPATPWQPTVVKTTSVTSTPKQTAAADGSDWTCGFCGASLRVAGPNQPCPFCGSTRPHQKKPTRRK